MPDEMSPSESRTATPVRRTSRPVLWAALTIIAILLTFRLTVQLPSRISETISSLPESSELSTPGLNQLAISAAVLIALFVSILLHLIYLGLCVALDNRILASKMLRLSTRAADPHTNSGVGYALILGVLVTAPIQLVALLSDVTQPKQTGWALSWIAVCTVSVCAALCFRHPRPIGRNRTISVAIVVALASLSLLV